MSNGADIFRNPPSVRTNSPSRIFRSVGRERSIGIRSIRTIISTAFISPCIIRTENHTWIITSIWTLASITVRSIGYVRSTLGARRQRNKHRNESDFGRERFSSYSDMKRRATSRATRRWQKRLDSLSIIDKGL